MSVLWCGDNCPICGLGIRTVGTRLRRWKDEDDGLDVFSLCMRCDECDHPVGIVQTFGERADLEYVLAALIATQVVRT